MRKFFFTLLVELAFFFNPLMVNAQFNQFTFLKGNTTDYRYGSYGTQGVASVSNNPGKRILHTTWELNNKMYIFGGEGNAAQLSSPGGNPAPPVGYMNDLWEYDLTANNWRWLKGSNTLGASPVTGTQGVAAAANTPGARKNGASWVLNGKIYLFGGYVAGRLNDLWEYDPITNNWKWLSGTPTSSNIAPVYGTQGVYDAANNPGGREEVLTWVYNNKFYLFGGIRGITGIGDVSMSDIWEYDPALNQWCWISGPSAYNNNSVVGTPGVGAAGNYPGGRFASDAKIINDKLYVYGGWGYGTGFYHKDDLWEFDHATGFWRLLMGGTENGPIVLGTPGVYSSTNSPGARHYHKLAVYNNTLYLYGGNTFNSPSGLLSDLWQYDPSLNQWRFVKGNTGVNNLGTYGLVETEASTNLPAARKSFTFSAIGNNLYLFGGRGYSGITSASDEYQNDLWKFNTTTNNWTWMNGPSGKERYGEYGTQGVASATNKPGDRLAHAMASLNNKIYMFGGEENRGYNFQGKNNDVWEYDPATNNWKFLKGSSTVELPENYGVQGVSSPTNLPGARSHPNLWSLNNKIYMFGGGNWSYKNDMWEYDPATNNWTWLKGSILTDQPGVYGTKGTSAPGNTPGGRWQSASFTYNNKLYLFGGEGFNSTGTFGMLNDLWEYDPATNNWTWINGDDAVNVFGVYGTLGVADAANKPGARVLANAEIINNKIYLFGNLGYGPSGIAKLMNDLWEYDFPSGLWKWIKGSNTGTAAGSTGTLGIEAPTNMPGARGGSTGYTIGGKLYIFGGTPFSNNYNDLWEYNPATNNWRWIKGVGNISNRPGDYGLTGIASNNNVPTDRKHMPAAVIGNTAYFLGGGGMYANNTGENFNNLGDLWKWEGTNNVVPTGSLYVNDNSLANDVFTTAVGNDANTGTPASPLASLDYAIFIAQPGDIIYVDAGTYVTPNFTIGKAITIRGTNYLVSPNNPADKWLVNPARIAESKITGGTITLQSSDITVTGITFLPTGSGFLNSVGTFSNITLNKNIFESQGNSNFITLNNGSATLPYGSVDYIFSDNRFLKTDDGFGGFLTINRLRNIQVSDNTFLGNPLLPRRNTGFANTGSANSTDFIDFLSLTNNRMKELNNALNLATLQNSSIVNNDIRDCNSAISMNYSATNAINIQILSNTISNTRGSNVIAVRRISTTATVGGIFGLSIRDNIINHDVSLSTSTVNSLLSLEFGNTGGYGPTEILRNKINISGDYTPSTSSTNCGMQLNGQHTNTTVSGNELTFTATNQKAHSLVFPPQACGIYIQTDGGTGYASFIGGPGFLVTDNKINGFNNSVAFYDPSSVTANGFNASVGFGFLASGATANINNNSFTSDVISINNGTTSQFVNATCNWYGGVLPSYLLTKITTGTVSYVPWLTNGTDDDLITTGFQPVAGSCNGAYPHLLYVNDNSLTGDVFTNAVGNNANDGTPSSPLATLTFALGIAQPGDTIYVDAGTYVTPNFTIGKAITILGPNSNISPNDATNPLLYNTGRNAEAIINNSTITIGASNINIEGFTFDPLSKSQILQTNSTLDFSNIKISRNRFIASTNFSLINLFGKNITPLTSNNYFIVNNRFEKTGGTGNTNVILSFINVAYVSGNVFTVANAGLARIQSAINIGSSGKVDNLTIAGNIFDRYNGTVSTTRFGTTLIDDNKFYDCQSGLTLTNSISEPAVIRVSRNLMNNIRSGPISYNRTSTNDNSSPNKFICEDNTINLDATGQTPLASSVILSTVQASTVLTANIETSIKRNRVTYTGDFTATPNFSILGLRFAGRHTNILIDSNEINLNGTNISPALATASTGILIFSNPGTVNGTIPANAIINIKNNKIKGFKQSVTFNNPLAGVGVYGGLLNGITANINSNSFTEDSISINNGTVSQTINANCNWYGVTSAQALLNKITPATVNYSPWLTNGTDIDLPTVGFQPMANVCNGTIPVITLDAFTNITCNGANNGTVSITVSGGTAPYTFNWSNDGNQGFNSNEDLTNLPPGTYSLTLTDANGSTASLPGVIITEPALLSASATGSNVDCNGNSTGSASVSVSGGTASYNYLWSNSETTVSISNLAAGTYSVTVTDANGCTATSSYEVTQPAVVVAIASGSNVDCNGNSTGSASVSVSGGTALYSYLWSNGATTASLSNLSAGNYSVTVTDGNGCTANASYEVTQPTLLVATATGSNVDCNGNSTGSASVSVSGGTASYSYLWSNGETTSSSSNLAAGAYMVTVTDANGCTAYASYEVTEPDLLIATASGSDVSCFAGEDGAASVSVSGGTPGYSYLWSNGATTQSITGLIAGTYSVTVTDANGCTSLSSYEVTQPLQLSASATGSNVSCFGGSDGSAQVNISGGTLPYTYLWSNGSTTQSIIGLVSGSYSVTVTDDNGCTIVANYVVTQPALLTVTLTGTTASCNGSVTATPSGGTSPYTYLWSNGAVTQSINSVPAGIYSVTVTDANNCMVSGSFTITGNSPINPTVQLAHVNCFGQSTGSITVTGAGGVAPHTYNLNGSPFQANNLFNNLPAGVYIIGAKDANGCADFITRTITQPTLLTVVLDSLRKPCGGLSNGRIYITATGGSGGKTYSWTGPNGFTSTTQDPNNLVAGNYSVVVTDGNGCTKNLNVVLPEWPAITISEVITNVACRGGFTGSINTTIGGGTGSGFAYSWTGPNGFVATTEDISGLISGNYKITVTDAGSSCTLQKTITVTQPASVVNVSVAKTNITTCGGAGTITATGSGGTAPYEYNLDGGAYQSANIFNVFTAGVHTITARDVNGCTKTINVTITDTGSDSYEANNSRANAALISINITINARIAPAATDVDWFKFTTGGTVVTHTLSFSHPNIADYTFALYNNSGTLINPGSSTTGNKTYSNLAVNTTYNVKITSTTASLTCYDLAVTTPVASGMNGTLYTETDIPVKEEKEGLKVSSYPNPHNGQFNLKIESTVEGMAVIQLLTVEGKMITTKNIMLLKGKSNIVHFSDIRQSVLFYQVILGKHITNGKIIGPN